ncbi:unnamed protein product [Auanema sp. JU1783]|nr:unnamed protein product [Auanema sp. JU1783]
MEHQNLSLVWKSFIEAARVGTGRHGSRNHKVQASRTALNLSDQLVTNNYNTGDLYKTWLENIKKVTAFLEADLVMIKRTVRDHFSILHSGDQADFSIDFTEKTGGMSVGIIADIDFCGMASRFYIKSHQRGPRPSSISVANRYVSMKPPFIQEMFNYELSALLKLGGEVHYILPQHSSNKKAMYIATKSVEFTLAKDLTRATTNYEAMFKIFFLEYILSLEDVLTNSGNYGQKSQGQPAVIDFW